MMLTEEEAKTKWCPEVIASHTDPRRGFHPGEEPKQYHQSGLHLCIGSACMAWRWCEPICRNKEKGTLHHISILEAVGSNKENDYERLPQKGYCGKAGEP